MDTSSIDSSALALAVLLSFPAIACEASRPMSEPPPGEPATKDGPSPDAVVHPRADEREEMVRTQLRSRDIVDPRVLEAMRTVPRHEFVPDDLRRHAYRDGPLPIGHDVTISQPYIVALMSQLAEVSPGERVLDVGTGSGYQAAVLSAMGAEVYGIEIIEPLATSAAERLKRLGYAATIRHGDGYRGWPEHAPFDAIILAAAPTEIPVPLTEQLAIGGHLVLPVGPRFRQELIVVTRTKSGLERERVTPVAFVPMTGEAQRGTG